MDAKKNPMFMFYRHRLRSASWPFLVYNYSPLQFQIKHVGIAPHKLHTIGESVSDFQYVPSVMKDQKELKSVSEAFGAFFFFRRNLMAVHL